MPNLGGNRTRRSMDLLQQCVSVETGRSLTTASSWRRTMAPRRLGTWGKRMAMAALLLLIVPLVVGGTASAIPRAPGIGSTEAVSAVSGAPQTVCAGSSFNPSWVVTAIYNSNSCGVYLNTGNTYVIAPPTNGLAICSQATPVPTGWVVTTMYNTNGCGVYLNTGNTYVIASPTNGLAICSQATPVPAGWYVTNTYSSSACELAGGNTSVIFFANPVNTAQPIIAVNGFPRVGTTFNASPGTWSGQPSITFSYQWNRCSPTTCAPIAGATSTSYVATTPDIGDALSVTVRAQNRDGSAIAASATTPAIGPPEVVAFQGLNGSSAYVLDTKGNLWLDSGPWGEVPPARQQVDAGVSAFQALSSSSIYVLGNGNLWLESGPWGKVPPARQQIDG